MQTPEPAPSALTIEDLQAVAWDSDVVAARLETLANTVELAGQAVLVQAVLAVQVAMATLLEVVEDCMAKLPDDEAREELEAERALNQRDLIGPYAGSISGEA